MQAEVLLPKTNFSPKSNWLEKEPQLLKLWNDLQVYKRRNQLNTNGEFTLHDGPPYANGNLHLGHFVNKMLKDFFVRYNLMKGKKVNFKVGFDCHGLPTELEVLKLKGEGLSPNDLRRECYKFSNKQLEKQKDQMSKWGLFYDSDHYATTQPSYESKELRLLFDFLNDELLFQEERPVWYSPSSKTVLAESELEYKSTQTETMYVKYFVKEHDLNLVVWTTQPWTLLGNKGLAVNKNMTYSVYEHNGQYFVVAKDCTAKFDFMNGSFVEDLPGDYFVGLEYLNPLYHTYHKVHHADFVSEHGTGTVHLCPAHGEEDFEVLKGENAVNLVDDEGNLSVGDPLTTSYYWEDSFPLMERMTKNHDMFLKSETVTHDYPFDWRTGKKVLMRLEKQFFLRLDKLKSKTLTNMAFVQYSDTASRNRLAKAVDMRERWCLSRQRKWGFPLAVFLSKNGNVFLNRDSQKYLVDLFAEKGSRVWFEYSVEELLPEELKYLAPKLTKSEHTVDVWFDSSASWYTVLEDQSKPADMYLEGVDQARGWFQGSLLLSTAKRNSSPFLKLFTHGFVVDEKGMKMSKSLGNVVTVEDAKKKYNTDMLRMWVLTAAVHNDLKYGHEFMETVGDHYFRLRNTMKFLLGNLYGCDDKLHSLSEKDQEELDYSNMMVHEFGVNMDSMNLRMAFGTLLNYVKEFSSRYVDVQLKCDLYEATLTDEKRQARQMVLHVVTLNLLRVMAVLTPFLAEDAYQNMPEHLKKHDSVFFLKLG